MEMEMTPLTMTITHLAGKNRKREAQRKNRNSGVPPTSEESSELHFQVTGGLVGEGLSISELFGENAEEWRHYSGKPKEY
nr:hypothetical protein Itr_chr07CG05330 [Ipomoea trifida]